MSKIGCAACGCALQGPGNASLEDYFSCPGCGEGGSLKAIADEIAQAMMRQTLEERYPTGAIAHEGRTSRVGMTGIREARFVSMA